MLRTERKTLTVVVPLYNEAACIPELIARLVSLQNTMSDRADVDVILVDDGSTDASALMIMRAAEEYSFLRIIKLSRNFGHQIAITAGLDAATGDYVCIIDADLQDPPELIARMFDRAVQEELSVVYGVRRHRPGETRFKLITASAFYWFLRSACRVNLPNDTGDFRLIDRKVVAALRGMREKHRFIRGMIPWAGFKSAPFVYDRDVRYAGETKYPIHKMVPLAISAILSFSVKPLRIGAYVGISIVLAGCGGLGYMIYLKLFTDVVVPGITVVLTSIFVLNGFAILMLGVVGEYIGRIFEEAKNRPLYLVDTTYNLETRASNVETAAVPTIHADAPSRAISP
jgi:dolichol-phosphate mannosyltransferase